MRFVIRRRRKERSPRASDGSMPLLDHVRELRDRLFKATVGVFLGFMVGWFLSDTALRFLQQPYCQYARNIVKNQSGGHLPSSWICPFVQLQLTDVFTLKLKVALWVGLIVSAPIWLYQVWAFIAPGLHRHERRWAYWFIGIATPLFALGSLAAYVVVDKGLAFLLQFTPDNTSVQLEITAYVEFVTNLMLLFGAAFEFPLVIVLFNLAGLASARRLLGWWRIAVFFTFLFAAVATPTPDPFGMTFLALALSSLYFAAVGFAFINDRRRDRACEFGDLDDDEISPLDPHPHPLDDRDIPAILDPVIPVASAHPLDRRYDDST